MDSLQKAIDLRIAQLQRKIKENKIDEEKSKIRVSLRQAKILNEQGNIIHRGKS